MNAKAQQINHEVIGQHSSQLKGETMNTKMIKDSRKRFLSLTAVGLLTAVMSHVALADVIGPIRLSPDGRISIPSCYANSYHISGGSADQPVKFKVIKRDYPDQDRGTTVFETVDKSFYNRSDGPGYYEVAVRNIQLTTVNIMVLASNCY